MTGTLAGVTQGVLQVTGQDNVRHDGGRVEDVFGGQLTVPVGYGGLSLKI